MEDLSTNAEYRDGVMRSSEEGAVMVLARRRDLIPLKGKDNCASG